MLKSTVWLMRRIRKKGCPAFFIRTRAGLVPALEGSCGPNGNNPGFIFQVIFMEESNILEQRRHQRFVIPEAIVVTPGNVCQLVNLSSGGLSLTCIRAVGLPTKWSLDIIIAGTDFHLKQIPVELLWVRLNEHREFLAMHEGTAGIKFDGIQPSQRVMLDNLISEL